MAQLLEAFTTMLELRADVSMLDRRRLASEALARFLPHTNTLPSEQPPLSPVTLSRAPTLQARAQLASVFMLREVFPCSSPRWEDIWRGMGKRVATTRGDIGCNSYRVDLSAGACVAVRAILAAQAHPMPPTPYSTGAAELWCEDRSQRVVQVSVCSLP